MEHVPISKGVVGWYVLGQASSVSPVRQILFQIPSILMLHCSCVRLMAPTISGPSPKNSKRPPLVAPKPRTHSTTTSDTYQQEDPSSFLEEYYHMPSL